MKYSNLRSYNTVKEKFNKSKKSEFIEDVRGIINVSEIEESFFDVNGNVFKENVAYHYWSKEYSCYVTSKFVLYY